MIYYLSTYGNGFGQQNDRELITSQACVNRVNDVIETLKQFDDVTIVNCALSRSGKDMPSSLERMDDGLFVYYPLVSKANTVLKMVKDCISFFNSHLKDSDVLVCYNAHYLTSLIVFGISKKHKFKLIYQVEELFSTSGYYGTLKRTIMKYSERMMSRKCLASMAVNENLVNAHLLKKANVISYGYCVRGEKDRPDEAKAKENYSIVYSGRLDADGGVDLFLQAVDRIDFKCQVIVTGTGEMADLVKIYVPKNDNVTYEYAGFVSQDTLDVYLSNADICVSTLRTDRPFSHSSFPSKVFQYLSYGGKVVSSDLSSLGELKEFFSNLYVYEGNDPMQIFECLKRAKEHECGSKKDNVLNFEKFILKKKDELRCFFEKIMK